MSAFYLRDKSFNDDRNHHQYTIRTAHVYLKQVTCTIRDDIRKTVRELQTEMNSCPCMHAVAISLNDAQRKGPVYTVPDACALGSGCGSMGTLHTSMFLFFANNFFLMCAINNRTPLERVHWPRGTTRTTTMTLLRAAGARGFNVPTLGR